MKRRKLTEIEKKQIDEAIKHKVKRLVPPKAQSCDYWEGSCAIGCVSDPQGTTGCPPCPGAESGQTCGVE